MDPVIANYINENLSDELAAYVTSLFAFNTEIKLLKSVGLPLGASSECYKKLLKLMHHELEISIIRKYQENSIDKNMNDKISTENPDSDPFEEKYGTWASSLKSSDFESSPEIDIEN